MAITSGENCRVASRVTLSSLPARTLSFDDRTALADRAHHQDVGGQVDRAGEVEARIEQHRQGPGEPRGVDLAAEESEDRRHQHHPIHDLLARGVL